MIRDGGGDDRSVSFSLAVMVAEWATGRFPTSEPSHELRPFVLREIASTPLRQLIERALAPKLEMRPRLRELVDALATLPDDV